MQVKAKDKASNKEQSIRIEASTGLSKEEIERMKQDAQTHAEEDKKRKEMIEVKNTADSLIYTAEKALRDAGDNVPQDITSDVRARIDDLKKAKDGDDAASIQTASSALSQSMSKIGEHLSKAQQTGSETPSKEEPKQGDEHITDAEYKDVSGENQQ